MEVLDSTIASLPAIELVKKYYPCHGALKWLADKTVPQAWEVCERGDWMLWYYSRAYPDNIRELTLVKGHIAHTIIHLMEDPRSIAAVYAAIRFGENLIGKHELKIACDAAYLAADAAYEAGDAGDDGDAAYEAAYEAYLAAEAAKATAINYDAGTFAYSVAIAAANSRENSLKESAEICRRYLKIY